MVTLATLQNTFDEVGEKYHVLRIGDEMHIFITQRGARVLGIFPAPDSHNLLWSNEALYTADGFRAFRESGNWNMGGERCWIAPEVQYNITDRIRFFETLSVPPRMDPGQYTFMVDGNRVNLRATMELEAHVLATGKKTIFVNRSIAPTANPFLWHHDGIALADTVSFGGYTQEVTLKDTNDSDILSEIWNLVQVIAGGTLIIPCTPTLDVSDYFGSPTDETKHVERGAVRIPITGARQFKVGYKALCMSGRMGYYRELYDGTASLLVRHFPNNPGNPYAEEPPALPNVRGHSVHVYNDDGGMGGENNFGEMECTGTTIGRSLGKKEATDLFQIWVYAGAPSAVKALLPYVLGVDW